MSLVPKAWGSSHLESHYSLKSIASQCLCARAPCVVSDVSAGEQICQNCGVVLSADIIDYTPVSSSSSSSSCHPIYHANTNTRSKSLMRRLCTILDQIHTTSQIRTYPSRLCGKIVKNNLYKGCKRHPLIAALVMISCKLHGKTINPQDVVDETPKKTVQKLYRAILADFQINFDYSAHIRSIITKMCTVLNLHQTTLKKALHYSDILMDNAQASGINSKYLGGYRVYRASDKEITLGSVAYVSSVSISCISRVKHIGL